MKTITLSRNGANRTIPTGFSWTTLFFGPVPSVIRSHWAFVWKVMAADLMALLISMATVGPDWWLWVWLVLRVAISMIRNDVLRGDMVKDGWSKEPMQKGIELRGNVADAANDDEEYEDEQSN
jgi:hypothetical protein